MLTRITLSSWLLLVIACASEPKLDIPPPSAGTGAPMPPDDTVAECDQARDGTPCDAAHLQKHCIFGVCERNVCGDGVPAHGEQCDDGNDRNGDGCSALCRFETEGHCGNGVKEGSEECDDGNRVDGDLCANHCLLNVCRNGRVDVGEECDDGNLTDSGESEPGIKDTCSNDCKWTLCGNLRVDVGEECDDGNRNNEDACANACTINRCGNTREDPGEICDGGNNELGAPCMSDCSGYGIDECLQCMSDHCRVAESGDDFYTPCRETAPGGSHPNFVTLCSAFDDCVRRTRCYDENYGAITCYCGDYGDDAPGNLGACLEGTRVMGACEAEAAAASLPQPGLPIPDQVFGQISDFSVPVGMAAGLAACRVAECRTECSID